MPGVTGLRRRALGRVAHGRSAGVRIDAPADAVFAVLADADAYAQWVVGAKEIRSSDPDWPNVGSRFYHSVGAGAATIDDSTAVLACEPERRLELEVRFRPAGVARVSLELEAQGASTRVTMREVATQRSGPQGVGSRPERRDACPERVGAAAPPTSRRRTHTNDRRHLVASAP